MSVGIRLEDTIRRIDGAHARIENPYRVPVTLFARSEVPIEAEGLEQLMEFLSLQDTLGTLWDLERRGSIAPFWGDGPGTIASVVITPDFHRGGGIPVGTVADARGFVVPAAVGNDVCCGMRLLVTDITRDELMANRSAIEHRLRGIFFQGQRDIPMSPRQRNALLRDGLWGLHETSSDNGSTGIWQLYDRAQQSDDLARVHFQGVLPAKNTFGFDDFIRASGEVDGRDPQIGSIGGGNHFVEVQCVEEIIDGPTAHAWGLKKDVVTVMVHSGSVGLGHAVGGHFCARAHGLYPTGVPHPKHGFYVLPTWGPHKRESEVYLDAMRNAANFAFGNRLFLGLMALRAMREAVGREVGAKLLYDAPHNLIWEPERQSGSFLHRKGATPALGPGAFEGPFQYTGHPVLIPGSMGASSFVLAGAGNASALSSACHGAGRSLTRGRSIHVSEAQYTKAVEQLRVVTSIDPASLSVRGRRDVLEKYHRRLKEEAPYAYKSITSVVQSVEDADVARRVVRLWPLVTVKG